LVLATTQYADPLLRQLRAPADDAQALIEVLGSPAIGGFAVTQVIDADERDARRAIGLFLSERGPEDIALVYLSCHGVRDRRNRLYFAATDTVKDQLSSTAIPSAWLLECLDECRARRQVIILDCCFSGSFANGAKGNGDLSLKRELVGDGRGRVVLTASGADEYSFEGDAVIGTAITGSVFTVGLVEGLRTGDADASGTGYISVDAAYDYAYRYVRSTGASQTPKRWVTGGEGSIVLARNPAGKPNRASLPDDLAATLDSRYPQMRIGAVHVLGDWLTGTDPVRAVTAEQHLRKIANADAPTVAAAARSYLAEPGTPAVPVTPPEPAAPAPGRATATPPFAVMPGAPAAPAISPEPAATEPAPATATPAVTRVTTEAEPAPKGPARIPDRAARLLADAESTAYAAESDKPEALSYIAGAVALADPERAESIAQSVISPIYRPSALGAVAMALVPTAPDRAERIAQSAESLHKMEALVAVARALTPGSVNRAERIARSMADERFTGERYMAEALAAIAEVLVPTDPHHAARLFAEAIDSARSNGSEPDRLKALAAVAKALASSNHQHAAQLFAEAERLARSGPHQGNNELVLRYIATALAPIDPDRAERIARSHIAKQFRSYKATTMAEVARALALADPDRAARLLRDAERAARSIRRAARSIGDDRTHPLMEIAKALAPTNPDRAELIARSITQEFYVAYALADVAEALAPTDPERAELVARSITVACFKARALAAVAAALIRTQAPPTG
jgi:hypothetical protein